MRRRDLLAFLGTAVAAWPIWAQPPPKQYRIVIADPAFTENTWRNFPIYRPLFPELSRLGDVEGVNLKAEISRPKDMSSVIRIWHAGLWSVPRMSSSVWAATWCRI
jgi:hypothetical protein